MENNTFCPIPWIFQAVRNNGDIRVCCQANVTKNQGVVRHKNKKSYNAGIHNLAKARNADLMKKIRLNMLNGEWNNECERCKVEENSGLNSRRQYELEQWKYSIEDAKKDTEIDGSIKKSPVVYYDLRFGNFCNLACRMCGPTDSHTWYKQWLSYHNSDTYIDTHGVVKLYKNEKGRWVTKDYDWHESKSFWKQLDNNIQNIQHVYMAGGEPLLIEKHYDFLEKCIDKGYSKNITIEYNTNMTVLPDRVLDMWTHFKQVRVGASIDGKEEVLEYQRWPIKWTTAYENLLKLDKLCAKSDNVIAWLAFTVTAYNVWHLPDFMQWKLLNSNFKKINSSKRRPIITHHVAHGPKRTNIKILPNDIKKEITQKYNDCCKKSDLFNVPENTKQNFKKILQSVNNYLMQDIDSKYFEEFLRFTNFIDKERNQNIVNVFPLLKKYI